MYVGGEEKGGKEERKEGGKEGGKERNIQRETDRQSEREGERGDDLRSILRFNWARVTTETQGQHLIEKKSSRSQRQYLQ